MVVEKLLQLAGPSTLFPLRGGRAAMLPVSCLQTGRCGGPVSAGAQLDLAEVAFSWWCQEFCGFLPFLLTS